MGFSRSKDSLKKKKKKKPERLRGGERKRAILMVVGREERSRVHFPNNVGGSGRGRLGSLFLSRYSYSSSPWNDVAAGFLLLLSAPFRPNPTQPRDASERRLFNPFDPPPLPHRHHSYFQERPGNRERRKKTLAKPLTKRFARDK